MNDLNYYVYDLGCVDFFNGMTRLRDYITLSHFYGNTHVFYHTHKDLKQLLIKLFMCIKSHETDWEGDIRSENIAISAIPMPNGRSPKVFIVFKQDNNGSSFMVSEFNFSFDDQADADGMAKEVLKLKPLNSQVLLKYFNESFDLVEKLFNSATQCECVEEKVNEVKPIQEIKTEDKFDLNNYESL
jgi:hypothetical protein